MTTTHAATPANPGRAAEIRVGAGLSGCGAATAVGDRGIRVVLIGGRESETGRLTAMIEADGDAWVAAVVGPGEALEAISRTNPDVVVVALSGDHDGAGNAAATATIRLICDRTPTPILVVQPRGGCGGAIRMAALVAGAIEVVSDPVDPGGSPGGFRSALRNLQSLGVWAVQGESLPELGQTSLPVLALGASAGGPEALAVILGGLSGLAAPVIVAQHLDPRFQDRFLELLRGRSALPVVAALDGASLEPRKVYVAPADRESRLVRGRRLAVTGTPQSGSWPMIDILISSLAESVGRSAVGVLLTGMGADGAAGLLRLRQAGGLTIAQDEESSDIFGMPRAARDAGAVCHMLPLREIAPAIVAAVNGLANRPYLSRAAWMPAA